jgi:hypothetical protein
MTYQDLLSEIYANYTTLLQSWDAEMEKAENIGAYVFLPDGYCHSKVLSETKSEFWTLPEVQAYLVAGGETDNGLFELLVDFEFGEEFLVMIVEYLGDARKHAVHVHKITKVGLN